MTITPDQIARLRELLSKATPGPWAIEPHGSGLTLFSYANSKALGFQVHPLNLMKLADFDINGEANREIIVAAINALPELLQAAEELERARQVIEACRNLVEYLGDQCDHSQVMEDAQDAIRAYDAKR